MNKLIKISLMLASLALAIGNAGCSDADECVTNDRYLVVKPYAGMANRLRVLASSKIMAALTDRKLVIDWTVLPNELPGKWSDFFLTPMTMFEDSELVKTCSLKAIVSATPGDPMIKNIGSQNNQIKGIDSQQELAKIPQYNEPIVYFETSLNFPPKPEDLSPQEYKDRYSIFYQNLDPTLWVANSVKKFKKDLKFDDFFMIGVHYRGWQTGGPDTRDIRNPDQGNKYIDRFITEMKKAVNEPLTNTDNKPVAFFLAADNEKVKQKIMATPELAGRIFTRSEEIERNTIRGQESALVDWYLLGSTEYIIGTYQSSFSDEAKFLTKQKRKVDLGDPAYSP